MFFPADSAQILSPRALRATLNQGAFARSIEKREMDD